MQKNSDIQYKAGYIYTLCTIASLGNLFYGVMLTIFTPVQDYFLTFLYPGLGSAELGFIIACVPIGGAIGSSIAGETTSRVGRHRLIVILDIITIIVSSCSLVVNKGILIASRLILGLCVGFNSVVSPLYQIEVVPNPLRGLPGTYSQLFMTGGIFTTFVIGLFIPGKAGPQSDLWRFLFLLPAIICSIRLSLFLTIFRFETPKYLVLKHREEEAEKVLAHLYHEEAIKEKLEELQIDRKIESSKGKKMTVLDLFKPRFRKRALLGCFLGLLQQLSGIGCVGYYANQIFKQGLEDPDHSHVPQHFSFYMTLINLIVVALSVGLVKKIGRKFLTVTGLITIISCHLGFFILGVATHDTSPVSKYLILIFEGAYGFSLGPAVGAYLLETLPDVGYSLAVLCKWIGSILGAQFFPILVDAVGLDYAFLLFAILCCIGLIIISIFMIETRGRSSQEVDELFYPKQTDNKKITDSLLAGHMSNDML